MASFVETTHSPTKETKISTEAYRLLTDAQRTAFMCGNVDTIFLPYRPIEIKTTLSLIPFTRNVEVYSSCITKTSRNKVEVVPGRLIQTYVSDQSRFSNVWFCFFLYFVLFAVGRMYAIERTLQSAMASFGQIAGSLVLILGLCFVCALRIYASSGAPSAWQEFFIFFLGMPVFYFWLGKQAGAPPQEKPIWA